MNTKIFSIEEKFKYHKLRSSKSNKNVTDVDKAYSSAWCDGFLDVHPGDNLIAVKGEIKRIEKANFDLKYKSLKLADLYGYRNGLIAQLSNVKRRK